MLDDARSQASVKHLLLGTNALGGEGAAMLSAAVREGHHIETLYLGCNLIDGSALQLLASALHDDHTVEALWLKRDPLGPKGIAHIADLLAANTSLRVIDLVNTGLDRAGLDRLAVGLRSNPANRIERLYIGGNRLIEDHAEAIVQLIEATPQLAFLSVAVNRLGDAGVDRLMRALEGRSQPCGLGAASNGLSAGSSEALRIAARLLSSLDLGVAPSTQVLGGVPNRVGDDGAIAAARTLSAVPSGPLTALDLRRNGVTSRGAGVLADALESTQHSLHTVELGNGIARSIKRRIKAELHEHVLPDEADVSIIASRYR